MHNIAGAAMGLALTVLLLTGVSTPARAEAEPLPTSQARFDDALPYGDEEHSDPNRLRRFHLGIALVGMRHVDAVGLGVTGSYGNYRDRFAWGGELFMVQSGDVRVPPTEARNGHYRDEDGNSVDPSISYVYESVGAVGIGASVYTSLVAPSPTIGFHRPGIALGVSGGAMVETDRVGLRPTDIDLYYGYGSSDTDLTLRPYASPHLVLSQGPLSVTGSVSFFAVFTTWSVGIAYGW